jgi:AraC-like DNA-binding protein
VAGEWVRYRRAGDRPLEAMHARFERHVYHRHSHDTYSFGVTEVGAQAFSCRGGSHTSVRGMVMAFNPDDPHDGRAAGGDGFIYRMVHIGPELLTDVLTDRLGRPVGRPLFAVPVIDDPAVAAALDRLHRAVMGPASALERDERLTAAVTALHRYAGAPHRGSTDRPAPPGLPIAARARDYLRAAYLDDLDADGLARAVGHSRFTVYRAFRAAYGLTPSDYQRQLRLRAARDLLVTGRRAARVAAETGFTDQAHLTRWFLRYFGLTPGAFQRSARGDRQ